MILLSTLRNATGGVICQSVFWGFCAATDRIRSVDHVTCMTLFFQTSGGDHCEEMSSGSMLFIKLTYAENSAGLYNHIIPSFLLSLSWLVIFLKKLKLLFLFCLLQPEKYLESKLRRTRKEKMGSWAQMALIIKQSSCQYYLRMSY